MITRVKWAVLSWLLVFATMIGLMPVIGGSVYAEEEYTYGDLKYRIENGEVTITGCDQEVAEVTIPDSIEGLKVTQIGNEAFEFCEISKVVIPESVKVIGERAFYCSHLTFIIIPGSVEKIEDSAFDGCYLLSDLKIMNGVKEIGKQAFSNCKLTSLTIPGSVKIIKESAFSQCDYLRSVTLTNGIEIIEPYAFSDCWKLEEIFIPESVTIIDGALCNGNLKNIYVDSNNSNFCSISGVLYDKGKKVLIQYPTGREDTFIIPNFVEIINDYSFYGLQAENIIISDSVTSIGKVAFYESFLNKIIIPGSVISVGDQAFARSRISELIIINGVKQIGIEAFSSCDYLKNVMIPNSVISIGSFAFDGCYNLEFVSLSNSLTQIEMYTFRNCDLKYIFIPNSIKKIVTEFSCKDVYYSGSKEEWDKIEVDSYYYEYCGYTLQEILNATIHYNSTDSDQCIVTAIPDGNGIVTGAGYYISGTFVTLSATPDEDQIFLGWYKNGEMVSEDYEYSFVVDGNADIVAKFTNAQDYYSIPFEFKSDFLKEDNKNASTEKCLKYECDYSDKWLFDNNEDFKYDEIMHELAKTSICLALAAYGVRNAYIDDSNDQSGWDVNSKESAAKNIDSLLYKLGFTNRYVYYPKPECDLGKPESDTIGYIIGSKNIRYENEEASIINISIRGGGYLDEWGGNFRVGNEQNHKGFQVAANRVLDGLANYLNEHESDLLNNKKIWITGYSRGAATANLVAAALDNDNERFREIGKNNVIAFCFECPKTTKKSNDIYLNSEKYNNIINIINPIDFVPKIPLDGWGYTRYGQTLSTPYDAGYRDYAQLKTNMQYTYNTLLNKNNVSSNGYTFETEGNLLSLNEALNSLATNVPLKDYIKYVEFDAMLTGVEFGSRGKVKNESVLKKWWGSLESMNVYSQIMADITVIALKNTGKNINEERPLKTMRCLTSNGWVSIIIINNLKDLLTHRGAETGFSHYGELALSWLHSISFNDVNTPDNNKVFREIFLNCPVDAEVYDSQGNLVGSFVNNEYIRPEEGVVGYIDDNDQKILCLPADEGYTIQVKATDQGEFTYTVVEQDAVDGIDERVVSYQSLDIQEGDELTGTISKMPETEEAEAEYTLSRDGEELTPAVEQTDDEVQEFTVDVSSTGRGTATGGGLFVNGEFAKVTAEPKEEESFLGWYEDDALLSEDSSYRFMVDSDTNLTAKFTSNKKILDAEVWDVSSNKVELRLMNNPAGTCIVSIFDEIGKPLTTGVQQIKEDSGFVDIACKEFVVPEHYTVKAFLTDSFFKPLLEPMVCEF